MGESASAAGTPVSTAAKQHSERLYVPWWGWPLPIIAAGLLAAEVDMGITGLPQWLPFVVLIPLMAAWLISLGRTRIAVTDGELWAGKAHLPLRFVGEVEVIDKNHKRKALGPELDPAAFVAHRGWVGPVLRVHLTDPADPTPYWIVSSRRPEALAELLRQ